MISVNSLWPRRLSMNTAVLGVPLVHISTDAVFSASAGAVDETSAPAPDELYGHTKLLGEPDSEWTISLRCSFVGPDTGRRRGLWSWVAAQPRGAEIPGFDDQQWTGVTSRQISMLVERTVDSEVFARLRAESHVHHLCPNPTVTKYELITVIASIIRPDLEVRPVASGRPVTRKLSTRTSATALLATGGPTEWEALIREAADGA
jgi:dTDP-4-dehydrorhamnose reductase